MTESEQNLQEQEETETFEADLEGAHTAGESVSSEEEPTDVYADWTKEDLIEALSESAKQREDLEQDLADVRNKATAAESEVLRMAADFQNARKRLDRMTQEQVAYAKEGMVTKLIAVLDDLDLAESNVPTDLSPAHDTWFRGVTQIREKIISVFQDEDVTPVDTCGAFDPNQHEAVQMVPSDDHESGFIVETLRKGYKRGEKVIRPAMVRIAQ